MKLIKVNINNINIERVDELNLLGLTLDTNLSWKHTLKISNKIEKIEIEIILYNTLILFHINYCTWGYECSRIMKIQKKAMRI